MFGFFKKMPRYVKIDGGAFLIPIHKHDQNKYIGRKIAEVLFRLACVEKFRNLHDFFCDIDGFGKWIDGDNLVFYWSYDMHGTTRISNFHDPLERTYKIQIVPNVHVCIEKWWG